MDIPVRHDEAGHRFTAEVGGQTAELTYVLREPNVVIFHHTYVPHAGRGSGVAGALAAAALDWARASGFGVVPVCSYVAAYMQRHPQYEDLLAR